MKDVDAGFRARTEAGSSVLAQEVPAILATAAVPTVAPSQEGGAAG